MPARQQLLKRQNLALVLRTGCRVTESVAGADRRSHWPDKSDGVHSCRRLDGCWARDRKGPRTRPHGAPGNPVGLNAQGPAGLGIEINVDYVSACVLDLTGTLRWKTTTVADNRLVTPETVLKKAARVAGRLCAKAEAAGLEISGLGVGVPGLVDFAGVLHRAPNLRDWEGLPVADLLCEMLARPLRSLYCDNEANLAALGERWFGGRDDLSDFVLVSGEIGVGAGIVIGGELFRGVQGLGGELGHVTVEPAGQLCSCGSRGCLETVAGIEALLQAIGEPPARTRSDRSAGDLLARALAGEPATLLALTRAGKALGVALGAFLNVLDVPTVVLGGFYALLAPWLTGPVSDELRKWS